MVGGENEVKRRKRSTRNERRERERRMIKMEWKEKSRRNAGRKGGGVLVGCN